MDTLSPVWNELWKIKNVPNIATLTVEVNDKDVGNITDDHLKKIKAVDKVRKEQRRQTVDGDLQGYVSLLSGGGDEKSVLDSASKRTDIVQYILVLAVDLINGMVIGLMNCLITMEDGY